MYAYGTYVPFVCAPLTRMTHVCFTRVFAPHYDTIRVYNTYVCTTSVCSTRVFNTCVPLQVYVHHVCISRAYTVLFAIVLHKVLAYTRSV